MHKYLAGPPLPQPLTHTPRQDSGLVLGTGAPLYLSLSQPTRVLANKGARRASVTCRQQKTSSLLAGESTVARAPIVDVTALPRHSPWPQVRLFSASGLAVNDAPQLGRNSPYFWSGRSSWSQKIVFGLLFFLFKKKNIIQFFSVMSSS